MEYDYSGAEFTNDLTTYILVTFKAEDLSNKIIRQACATTPNCYLKIIYIIKIIIYPVNNKVLSF